MLLWAREVNSVNTGRRITSFAAVAAVFVTVLAVVPGGVAGGQTPIEAANTVYAGIYPSFVDLNGVVHNGPLDDGFWDSQVLDTYDVGKGVTFAGRFHDVRENSGTFSATQASLEEAWEAKSTPFSNVTINASMQAIAAGRHDAEISAWADQVKAWLDRGGGRSLIIAPLQEMNGSWVPYACDPGNYKIAYQKFRSIFAAKGMSETQVRWAFAPNGWTSPGCGSLRDYYPGDASVDVIGISAYNFGTRVGNTWSSVFSTMGGVFNELRTFAPNKPYMLAQTGSCPEGGSKNDWLLEMFRFVAADANALAFVWFNFNKAGECDFLVANQGASAGWRTGMGLGTTKYQWPLTSWFQPGALPFSTKVVPTNDPCQTVGNCDSFALVDSAPQFHRFARVANDGKTGGHFFGNPGDFAINGDWDCNGTKTPGMFRQSTGLVYVRNSNNAGPADIQFFFGDPGDVPIVGDFNGDGCDTVSIYRPSQGQIFIVNKLGQNNQGLGAAEVSYFFGNPGDKPFVGDFDGDGIDTVGLHRESTGLVYFNNQHVSKAAESQFIFGDPGDIIVAGDWNGDGKSSPALYRPSTGEMFFKFTNTTGVADLSFFTGFGFTAVVRSHRSG